MKVLIKNNRQNITVIMLCFIVISLFSGCEKLRNIRLDEIVTTAEEPVAFALWQNTPNPAEGDTFIEYCIPVAGEVIFNINSVSGQVLYTQVIQSESGKHVIEVNTSDLAAGIYFYSIEYMGHKLVKRMSVKK